MNVFSTEDFRQALRESPRLQPIVPRAPKLSPYDGNEAYKVTRFVADYEALADYCGWSQQDRLLKFASYLIDTAKNWYELDYRRKVSERTVTWEEVKRAIEAFF